MATNSHLVPLMNLAIQDHVMLHQCIDKYRKFTTASFSPKEWVAAYEEIDSLIDGKIAAHFAVEEERIFPAVAQAFPTPKILACIAELEADHKVLLEKVHQIDIFSEYKPSAQGPNKVLNEMLLDLFSEFGRHAVREDKLFAEINRLLNTVGDPPSL